VACALVVRAAQPRLAAAHRGLVTATDPLWLPSSRYLRVVAVGHETTLADILYLWSIQYFSDPRESQRRKVWIERVYETITDLDPHFRDAYWLGFLTLLQEVRDPRAAFRLVDKALSNEPGHAAIAFEAAIAARQLGERKRAVHYMGIARQVGGDPLAERLWVKLQEPATAQEELRLWRQLESSPDASNRAAAATHVRDLVAFVDVERLQALVACYARERGRPPGSLQDLVTARYVDELPRDPEGAPYAYDPRTRIVSSRTPFRVKPPSRAREGVDLTDLGRCAPFLPVLPTPAPAP
jgi:hypothetical protein